MEPVEITVNCKAGVKTKK